MSQLSQRRAHLAARRVLIVHYYHTLQDYERDLLHFIDRQRRES